MAFLILGLVFFASGIFVGAWLLKLDQQLDRINRIEEEVKELRDQLKRRRHTYATQDGLDDAQAVLIDLVLRDQLEASYREARLGQLSEILGLVRAGPQKYDGEKPNHRPSPPD